MFAVETGELAILLSPPMSADEAIDICGDSKPAIHGLFVADSNGRVPQLKMSVERDSSGSDSDDLAAFFKTELESESDSASQGDAQVTNHRLKRQKLEAVTFSEQISEAFSSEGACKHSFIKNLCYRCGQNLVEETGRYSYMEIHPDAISSLRESDMRTLLCQEKLRLVLHLDQTLLNTTNLRDLTEEEGYLKSRAHSLRDVSGGDLIILESMGLMTKLRPYVHTFLKEASEMFELYIYTTRNRRYAEQMAKLLDPKGNYFGNRIISREDNIVRHRKSRDAVLGHERTVLILDDTENAWPKHKDHLIVIQRYHFFASSCRQFGVKSQSLSQLKKDESESYGSLASILRVLKETHRLFFEGGVEDLSGRDVRSILRQVI